MASHKHSWMHYRIRVTLCTQLTMWLRSNITSCTQPKAQKMTSLCEERMLWRVKWMTLSQCKSLPLICFFFFFKERSKKSFMTDSENFHPGRFYPQAHMLHDCHLWILCGVLWAMTLFLPALHFCLLLLTHWIPLQHLWKSDLRERKNIIQPVSPSSPCASCCERCPRL